MIIKAPLALLDVNQDRVRQAVIHRPIIASRQPSKRASAPRPFDDATATKHIAEPMTYADGYHDGIADPGE
ncbi:hypothetical protein [Dactylosporangium sp. NPDC048998]|uniref:hypothetical protein n=1 Tax=Dactylosporangium sp. NPDC048998 TaxID=3363976 RepID=UPI0037141E50